jgi:hypothetical protein
MPRIALVLNIQPSEIQVFVAYKQKDGILIPNLGTVDTGAEISLFPGSWLKTAEHQILREIEIEQAGLAKQTFQATEAEIIIRLEDLQGNISPELHVRAWFAETDRILIGFQDILDHATLHADFLQSLTGYIELQDKALTSR